MDSFYYKTRTHTHTHCYTDRCPAELPPLCCSLNVTFEQTIIVPGARLHESTLSAGKAAALPGSGARQRSRRLFIGHLPRRRCASPWRLARFQAPTTPPPPTLPLPTHCVLVARVRARPGACARAFPGMSCEWRWAGPYERQLYSVGAGGQ